MSGDATRGPAPLPIGRIGPRGIALALVAAAGLCVGIHAWSLQLRHGDVVTGMRTIGEGGAAWGLYISFDLYFVGVSFAGISLALFGRLFRIEPLRPLSRMAALLTIVALGMGGCCVLADLGRPLHGLMNLPRYARTMSPFFGTFSLVVGGSLFATLVYLYLSGRADAARCASRGGPMRWLHRIWASGFQDTSAERHRHERVSFGLALALLPLLVMAHSTLGFIFGIQGGRPGWYSALQAPGFVVMGALSGTGILIAVAAILRRALRLEGVIGTATFRWLGKYLLGLLAVTVYFVVAEELTAHYAASEADTRVARSIVSGDYALSFWTFAACLAAAGVLLAVQLARPGASIAAVVGAGLLVNVGAVLKRLLIVVPSQTHGMLLAYPDGSYSPTWIELAVVVGLFSLATLLFQGFTLVFPIVPLAALGPLPPAFPASEEPRGRGLLRLALFAAALGTGLSMTVGGFLLSARFGSDRYVDPAVPFSPVIFILGVMLSFYSAAIYETLPPEPRPLSRSP
jgi:molybdopterin-containing oxidoreductase family membrane subunit